ncbi:MAG: hypothetical protein QOD77_1719 [Thermoplasmata archaeon]|jgi:hypothetical protein|nr:hypothetical protein [Thermoplasmata archaeon]
MEGSQLASLLLGLLSGGFFALVGWTIHRRPVSSEVVAARDAFVLWWVLLGVLSVLGVALNVAVVLGLRDLALLTTLLLALLLLLCAAFWSLLCYLLYLYLNTNRLRWILAVAYTILFFGLAYFVLYQQPIGVEETRWGFKFDYAREPSGPAALVAGLLFLVPVLLGAAGYLSLYRKVDNPVLRRRILIVGCSILVWFGSSLPATSDRDLGENETWQLASRLIGLAATAAIYYAYVGLKPKTETPAMPRHNP